jgi:ribA/ribD-fused uncharacterized protein
MNKIYFKGGGFAPLSNMSAFRVTYKGEDYMTSEHAYQAAKFSDLKIRTEIINTRSPFEAKSLAIEYKDKVREDWLEVNMSVLKEIVREKLEQHPYIKQKLLSSGDAELIEGTDDAFWGQGEDGNGKNMFGKMWMELRQELVTT